MQKVWTKLRVGVFHFEARSELKIDAVQQVIVTKPSLARRFQFIRCLGPTLSDISLCAFSEEFDHVVQDILRFSKNLKSIVLRFYRGCRERPDTPRAVNLFRQLVSKYAHSLEVLYLNEHH